MTQSLRAGVRNMSSATEQEAKGESALPPFYLRFCMHRVAHRLLYYSPTTEQMHRWTTISKGMIALTSVYTVYAIGDHLSHEHHEKDTPAYPYLKMRTKPFRGPSRTATCWTSTARPRPAPPRRPSSKRRQCSTG